MGDVNLRIGKYFDLVFEGSNIIMNDQLVLFIFCIQRNSFDNVLNSNGKRLFEICKIYNFRVVFNGRVNGYIFGMFLFYGKNGIIVVDYIICD